MTQKLKTFILVLVTSITLGGVAAPSVLADDVPCGDTCSTHGGLQNGSDTQYGNDCTGSQSDCLSQNPITHDLNIVVNVLSGLVGVIVAAVIILGGIQYSLAGGNPQHIAAARQRILNGLIALVAFFLIFALLQWLIPGGVFS